MSEPKSIGAKITESSGVQLTLVIALCSGVWWSSSKLSGLEAQIQANALVQAERDRTNVILIEQLTREVRSVSERLRELEKKERGGQ